MVIDNKVLDELSSKAKASPRLRMNLDLRNSENDGSQRMLNAIEPGSEIPIHRHRDLSEIILSVRCHFQESLYDDNGQPNRSQRYAPWRCNGQRSPRSIAQLEKPRERLSIAGGERREV